MANTKKKTVKVKTLTAEEIQEQREEKYWAEVEAKSKDIIAEELNRHIPSEKEIILPKKMDANYRNLLYELQEQHAEIDNEDWSETKVIAEEIAIWYLRSIMKGIISDLSDFALYENHFFENLTEY